MGAGILQRFNGMWGLAIVDLHRGSLILSRDRLGIKHVPRSPAPRCSLRPRSNSCFAPTRIKAVANSHALVEYIEPVIRPNP